MSWKDNLKTLQKDDVKNTLVALIAKNGETTTLDVKRALRADEFMAKQHIVSQFAMELFDNDEIPGLDFTQNGVHRTYTISTNGANDDDDDNGMLSMDDMDGDTDTDDDDQTLVPAKPPVINQWNKKVADWKVFHKDDPSEFSIIENTTHGKARSEFASINGHKYLEVRARLY